MSDHDEKAIRIAAAATQAATPMMAGNVAGVQAVTETVVGAESATQAAAEMVAGTATGARAATETAARTQPDAGISAGFQTETQEAAEMVAGVQAATRTAPPLAVDVPAGELILQVADLRVAYGSVPALRGVSLEVRKGELVSICGVNGAGKSTVLKTIAGVLRPQAGTVRFKGREVTGKKPEQLHKLGMALVPEGREIFPTLTVAENLRLGAFGRYEAARFAADLEDFFGLFPILKERYRQAGGLLSGGEQQMLAIARGLISHPDLLMLDEPSLGLSPTRVDQIFQLILELKSRGITILLVEQNAERALAIADRAYLFSNGTVAFSGRPRDMVSAVDITNVYLGGRKDRGT